MKASAGAAGKGDALVTVSRKDSEGCEVVIKSPVRKLFGNDQDAAAARALEEINADRLLVTIEDCQALDFVIAARVKAAVQRLRKLEKI